MLSRVEREAEGAFTSTISHNLCPLSFIDVSREDYLGAIDRPYHEQRRLRRLQSKWTEPTEKINT